MRTYYHSHGTLSVDEYAHYAWLAGDTTPETMLDELNMPSPDLIDWLDDNGIYSPDQLDELCKAEYDLGVAKSEIVDLKAKIEELEDALRDATKFMREPLPADEVDAMADDLSGALS